MTENLIMVGVLCKKVYAKEHPIWGAFYYALFNPNMKGDHT